MDSSNKGLASSSSGKKMMIKPDGTKAAKKLRKMKKIGVIYTTAIPCTVEELDRRNGVQIETNSNPNHPDQTGTDEEAKQLKVDGEKKINDLASTSKSAGMKRSSSSSNDETNTNIAFENKRKKLSNQLSISSDVNSKQPMIAMMKEHTTKEGNKMELSNNHLTISDSSPVKDQARAGPSLLQLTDLLENFDVYCKIGKGSNSFVEEKEITGKGSNSFVDELRIGPPGSVLPSSDHDRGDSLSLTIGNDHIDRDSSDSLMSAAMSILYASKSPEEEDIHKKPAAFSVFRLMGKDILILVNAPPNNL